MNSSSAARLLEKQTRAMRNTLFSQRKKLSALNEKIATYVAEKDYLLQEIEHSKRRLGELKARATPALPPAGPASVAAAPAGPYDDAAASAARATAAVAPCDKKHFLEVLRINSPCPRCGKVFPINTQYVKCSGCEYGLCMSCHKQACKGTCECGAKCIIPNT
jgi:hypothetical protein